MLKLFYYLFFCLFFIFGCNAREDYARLAKKQADNAQILYEAAVQSYITALSQKDSPKLHFELGKLYYEHGQYELVISQLVNLDPKLASKILALSYFKLGDYTNALNIFDRNEQYGDSEYFYYFGLTCERLNLFEKAIENYLKIKDKHFKEKSKERIRAINLSEKNTDSENIFISQLIEKSGNQKDYPEAGAIILLAEENIEILPENKIVSYEHFLVKILNERGKQDFAEININYDSTYENVELEYARTIKPDGSVIIVGEKNIRDVSRYMEFPLYSNARSRIISMPEITEGAIIEYRAKITQNKMINDKEFNINYLLEDSNPIKAARFKVSVPKEKKLFIKVINQEYNKKNFKLEPNTEEEAEKVIYSWEFNDIDQIIPEADTPPIAQISPIILISTFSSWDEIYDWWEKLALPKINTSSEIEKKVLELTKGRETNLEKAKSIFNYCASQIRYVAVEYGQAGYEPHEAKEIFKNKYGDCKDQAILLVAMLRYAGLDAYPVLIGTKDVVDLNQDFPLSLFNHAICVVDIEGKLYFLDPTAETSSINVLPFGDQDRNVLVFKEDGYKILKTPLSSPEDNAIIYDIDMAIDKDGRVKGTRKISAFGQFGIFQRYWLKYSPPEVIKQTLNERLQEIAAGSKLIDYKIKNLDDPDKPVILTYDFSGGAIFISSGNLKILPELSSVNLSQVAKESRIYPLDLGFPSSAEINIEFKLDPSFKSTYLPTSFMDDSQWFNFENNYQQKDGKIVFSQKKVTKANEISVKEYPRYKKWLENLKEAINQRIILEIK